MLSRPSNRRKGNREQINLNLVPILDTMVTLIGFMLFTMSFLSLVTIESPFPEASSKVLEQKLKERPLQLTVSLRADEIEVWSPFDKFPSKTIKHKPEGPDLMGMHQALIEVKKQFPNDTKVIFVPNASANYLLMISAMDAMRSLDATDPTIYVKNAQTGVDEAVKTLFPEVIFGNLLGDS